MLTLDVRLPGAADVERVSRRIEGVARECGCEVRITHTREPFTMDPNRPRSWCSAVPTRSSRAGPRYRLPSAGARMHIIFLAPWGSVRSTEPSLCRLGRSRAWSNEGIWEHQLKRALAIYIRSLESLLNSKVGTDSEFD